MNIIEIDFATTQSLKAYVGKDNVRLFKAFMEDPKTDISAIIEGRGKKEEGLILLYITKSFIQERPVNRDNITTLIELLNTKYKPSNIEDYNFSLKNIMAIEKFSIGKISKHISPTITFMDIYGQDMRGISFQGSIDADSRQIDSLLGSPDELTGTFNISKTKLSSLVGAPKRVHHFECLGNKIKDLEGCPEIKGWGYFSKCKSLVSLKGATVIEEGLDIRGTGFTSNEDIIEDIVKHNVNVNYVFSDFGNFGADAINKARSQKKMGKFRDLLKFKEV